MANHHEYITANDIAFIIKAVKKQMGWNYIEMAEIIGIPKTSLIDYAGKRNFPRDPEKVIRAIQQAVKKEIQRRRQGA